MSIAGTSLRHRNTGGGGPEGFQQFPREALPFHSPLAARAVELRGPPVVVLGALEDG